jgi:acetyl esterase/lipase
MAYNKEDYTFVAQAFTSLGYSVVIPDYRHYPEHMFGDIMTDASNATTWIHNNISKFSDENITRIILAGHSSGAHMAAMLTLDNSRLPEAVRSSIAGFIGLAGPYDFLPFTEDYEPALFGPVKNYPTSQPINYVSGHDAPMLLLYGNDDSRVKPINIESLTRIARQAGDDVESHRYDGIDHPGILAALSRPLRDNKPVMTDIARFLNRVMKSDKAPHQKIANTGPAIREQTHGTHL